MIRRASLLASTLAMVCLVAGCGSDDDAASAPSGAPPVAAERPAEATFQQTRAVIYTADLVMRVSSADVASAETAAIAKAAGGFVHSEETEGDRSIIAVRVPQAQFEATLGQITALGSELRRSVNARDVTAEVVDIEGRLATAQASATRLRGLLAKAASTGEVVAIEGELARREAEIESLQGRLRVMNDQVDLATITIRFTERSDVAVADDLPGFLGGLKAGAVALANITLVALVVAGFLIPFAPIVAVVVWLVLRRRRTRAATVARRPLAPPNGAPPPGPAMPPGLPQTVAGPTNPVEPPAHLPPDADQSLPSHPA